MTSGRREIRTKAARLWGAVAKARRDAARITAKAEKTVARATAKASTKSEYMAAGTAYVATCATATEIKLRAARWEWDAAALEHAWQLSFLEHAPRTARNAKRVAPLTIPQIINLRQCLETEFQLIDAAKGKRRASRAVRSAR